MKCVILAGGFGTRISEESHLKPKPMLEIGGQPILWHIMKFYAYYGVTDFIICAGYKQQIIKEYFANYFLHRSDVTFDFTQGGERTTHKNVSEPWRVTVVDTGLNTMTGGRIKRIRPYIGNEPFFMTYGDGVTDVDLPALVKAHEQSGKLATLTAIQPKMRFGVLDIDRNNQINSFREKDIADSGWINGGYMVLEPQVFDYIDDDSTVFERQPLNRLAEQGQLNAFKHDGFWQCMDTMREMQMLDAMVEGGKAPWMLWEK